MLGNISVSAPAPALSVPLCAWRFLALCLVNSIASIRTFIAALEFWLKSNSKSPPIQPPFKRQRSSDTVAPSPSHWSIVTMSWQQISLGSNSMTRVTPVSHLTCDPFKELLWVSQQDQTFDKTRCSGTPTRSSHSSLILRVCRSVRVTASCHVTIVPSSVRAFAFKLILTAVESCR